MEIIHSFSQSSIQQTAVTAERQQQRPWVLAERSPSVAEGVATQLHMCVPRGVDAGGG